MPSQGRLWFFLGRPSEALCMGLVVPFAGGTVESALLRARFTSEGDKVRDTVKLSELGAEVLCPCSLCHIVTAQLCLERDKGPSDC